MIWLKRIEILSASLKTAEMPFFLLYVDEPVGAIDDVKETCIYSCSFQTL